jgi:hypothetical protein
MMGGRAVVRAVDSRDEATQVRMMLKKIRVRRRLLRVPWVTVFTE